MNILKKIKRFGIRNFKMYKGCLIIVDMVNGFTDEGPLHDEEIKKIIPRQIELIKEAKANGYAVVFMRDAHTPKKEDKQAAEFNRLPAHCVKGTRESQLVEEFNQFLDDDVYVFDKNSTSFMEAPGFRRFIRRQKKMEKFEIAGCCTDICDFNGTMGLANHLDQWDRPHEIIVHEDAIATFAEAERQNYVDAAKLLMEQQGIQFVKKMNKAA